MASRGLGSLLVFGLALTGCGATSGNSSVKATGKLLSIYVSTQSGAATDPQTRDVINAELLAFQQHASEVRPPYSLRLVPVTAATLSDNGRRAINNKGSIAYVGEILPATSADSAGITNAQDLLEVSPTDTALEFTTKTAAISDTPDRYYESLSTYGKTFARVVPNGRIEAKAQIQEMQSLGVKRLYIADDGTPYGRALALAMRQDAGSAVTLTTNPSSADAMFFASASPSSAARAFNARVAQNPSLKLFGPSGLDSPLLVSALGPAARNLFVSSPGIPNASLTPAGQQFVTDFKAKYGHQPASEAIFGYEAMAAVIDVIHKAGQDANNRRTVVQDFFAIKDRPQSVLGPYSINAAGDTSLASFEFNRVRAGALVPFTSVSVQG